MVLLGFSGTVRKENQGGGIGTERQAVTRGLPASSRQILSTWATGSVPGTTLKSETATVFPVCHIDLAL